MKAAELSKTSWNAKDESINKGLPSTFSPRILRLDPERRFWLHSEVLRSPDTPQHTQCPSEIRRVPTSASPSKVRQTGTAPKSHNRIPTKKSEWAVVLEIHQFLNKKITFPQQLKWSWKAHVLRSTFSLRGKSKATAKRTKGTGPIAFSNHF